MEATENKNKTNGTSDGFSYSEYTVFPGITVSYVSSHTESGRKAERGAHGAEGGVFEIYHCREGRLECGVDGQLCYISEGDLMIVERKCLSPELSFPLRHYHGMIISINTASAPECMSCFLQDVAVSPTAIEKKFCGEGGYFIARSNSSVEHIFSELYNVPDDIRLGYSKIKILELMLFLSVYKTVEGASSSKPVAPSQASLAKSVAEYLAENMDGRVTIGMAAKKFHVSETALKTLFKAVYGVSFYSYIKTRKMESAAYMLEYTDKTVLEIANCHGYDNSSKFAVAFRSVKGMSPTEYRLENAGDK